MSQLPGVQNLRVDVLSNTSVNVQWDAPTAVNTVLGVIDHYLVGLHRIDNNDKIIQELSNNIFDYTFNGLANNLEYGVYVCAVYKRGIIIFTYENSIVESVFFSTVSISNLACDRATISSSSARLTWNAPPAQVSNYTVTFSSGDSIGSTQNSLFDLTGLSGSTSYTILVTPYSVNNYRGYSSSVTLTTNTYVPPNIVPNNINVPAGGLAYNYAFIVWDPPLNNAGDVSYYKIVYGVMGSRLTETTSNITGYTNQTMSTVLSGLTGNTHYTFTLVSYSSSNVIIGTSSLIEFTTKYGPVTNVAISNVGKTTATISWSDSNNFASYKVINQENGNVLATTPTPYADLTGLMPNQAYTLYIEGYTSSGIRSAASATTTFSTLSLLVPSAPSSISASVVGDEISVTWGAPIDNGGSPILYYTVSYNPGAYTHDTSDASVTTDIFKPNVAGTYTVSVTARNASGESQSITSGPVVITAPASAPKNLSVTPFTDHLVITWDAPDSDGGNPIDAYVITYNPGNVAMNIPTPISPISLYGLTANVTYSFTVKAHTSLGFGAESTLVTSALTSVLPPADPVFTDFSANSGVESATVNWSMSAETNISTYKIYQVAGQNNILLATINATSPQNLSYSYTITSLTGNTSYTLMIIARSSSGSPIAMSSSIAVTPTPGGGGGSGGGGVPCFPAGVKIRTPSGEKPVETLKTGDLVLTAAGRAVPIRMHSYSLEETTPATAPYFIPAGAMGPKAPAKSLHLSPLHAFQVRPNVWWCAKEAAKQSTKIQQYGLGESITYYHVECPNFLRDNLIADGGVVESFAANQLTKTEKHNLYKFSKALGGFVRSNPMRSMKVLL